VPVREGSRKPRGIVGQSPEGLFDGAEVFLRGLDQEVYVLGGTDEAVKNDREPANQEIACSFPIQSLAQAGQVLEVWRA
jgi:hypothetical protein